MTRAMTRFKPFQVELHRALALNKIRLIKSTVSNEYYLALEHYYCFNYVGVFLLNHVSYFSTTSISILIFGVI